FAILGMLFRHASCRVHGFCRIVPSGTASRFQLDMPICYRWVASGPEVLASMELRSIQYLVQVADEGSITRTAGKIGIAQPALTPLCSEPLVVLSSPGARGTRHAFSLAELCATPFIVTVGLRTLAEQQLAAFGVGLRVEAEVDSVEAIRRLLISGTGMTIMPV